MWFDALKDTNGMSLYEWRGINEQKRMDIVCSKKSKKLIEIKVPNNNDRSWSCCAGNHGGQDNSNVHKYQRRKEDECVVLSEVT